MQTIKLSGEWQVCGNNPNTNDKITMVGTVPGSTLNDIITNKIEKSNPFWRDNAELYQKYELYNWHYSKEFELCDITNNTELFIGKLDTYCDVYLNGRHLAYCDNGHISYTFNTSNILKCGKNVLDIYLYSPITKVSGKPNLEGAFTTERMHTRRTQCTYGWDWVMRFVSCGIGDVRINMYEDNEPYIDNVYIYTKSIDTSGAYIAVKVDFGKKHVNDVYSFELYDANGNFVKKHTKYCSFEKYKFNLSVKDAQLWYPAGYGEQPLYELRISCRDKIIHKETFGIRTVKIIQEIDETGSDNYKKCIELKKSSFSQTFDKNTEFSSFILAVNGVKVLCMGGNWVPCEPFENGRTADKITSTLTLAREMGVNMIRVWGGGTFESKHFYNECSRLGIMVTQDFLMACGTYPEKEEWFIHQLQVEAQFAAKLIRNQPCLMWWSGDNENAVRGNDTMTDYTGRDSAFEGISPVLMELDPERDFLPSSPFGGNMYASNTAGTTHNTNYLGDVLNALHKLPLDDYKQRFKKLCARFIAEEPTFGVCSSYSNRKFMTEQDIYDNEHTIMRYHTKNNPGLEFELYDYMLFFAEKVLGTFEDEQDRNFKLKYIQYENVRLSLEQLKRERWFCSGVIFWMLNDCWPAAAGWAFIDYYLMPKASYYSFKRCAKPVICSVDKCNDKYCIYVSNDSGTLCDGELTIYEVCTDTCVKKQLHKCHISVPNGETELVHIFNYDTNSMICAEIDTNICNDRAFYKEGALNMHKTEVVYQIDENNMCITLTSNDNYIHAVELEGNIILDDNYFSLLPGETRKIQFRKRYDDMPLDINVVAYTC